MAWPSTLTASDVLAREGADSEAAGTIGQMLYDRDLEIAYKRSSYIFDQFNMTTSLADLIAQSVRIPSWALQNTEMKLVFKAKRSGSVSGTANFRLRETGVPTNGTTLSTTLTTSYAAYEVVGLTVPDDTWAGTVKIIALQAQRPASGVDADWNVTGAEVGMNLGFEPP